jgi:hypothetical protein
MKALKENAATHVTLYWICFAFWWLATGFDILAVANGQRSCENGFQDFFAGSTCDNSVYGVSIAIDCVMVCILAGLIFLMTAEASHEYRLARLHEQTNQEVIAAKGSPQMAAQQQPSDFDHHDAHPERDPKVLAANEFPDTAERPRTMDVESKEQVLDELHAEAGQNRV